MSKIISTLICFGATAGLHGQTFTSLASFVGSNGESPTAAMVQGLDGNLYGTCQNGGAHGAGAFFQLALDGTIANLRSFHGAGGLFPSAGPLILGADGAFYGTTNYGAHDIMGHGWVYRITSAGELKQLAQFHAWNGYYPYTGVIEAANGEIYGTTYSGGHSTRGYGEVYKVGEHRNIKVLYSFQNGNDGSMPQSGLIQAYDGDFYGAASEGGAHRKGTIFKVTPEGKFTTIHAFNGHDGSFPHSGLTLAADGDIYGTASLGGTYNTGTLFRIDTHGKLTTLHSMNGTTDGDNTFAALVEGTDGNFYGTAEFGGDDSCTHPIGCGTIFRVTPRGEFTVVHTFEDTDGSGPVGGLVQATDGNFYGTTGAGGSKDAGTVYRLSMGLGPFVKAVPGTGKAGDQVFILGTNLSGVTGVGFNGTAAEFTVVSATEITANVPAGASSGKIQVATSAGMLSSNLPFHVRPSI